MLLPAVLALASATIVAVAPVDPYMHPTFRLSYAPKRALPTYTVMQTSTNGAGKIHSVDLPSTSQYTNNPIRLIELEGSPAAVGEAYGELMGVSAREAYAIQTAGKESLLPVLDFLWDCSLVNETPDYFLKELDGIKKGGAMAKVDAMDVLVKRMVTAATLPSDTQNIEALIARETARHINISTCGKRGAQLLGPSLSKLKDMPAHGAGHCDFFAVWANMTEDGRLLSSRNLDIEHDTGLAKYKLITVYRIDGQVPYATFGFDGFGGALAGNSKTGLTVSEANLDNLGVAFDGLAWPLRLRHILGNAKNLTEARNIWKETPNTAAFNFLLASSAEPAGSPAAVALETIDTFTAEFFGDSPIEAASKFQCDFNKTKTDGSTCYWPSDNKPVQIGHPMANAVWRSNHALHPTVMKSQEPLWNDTVARYFLLRDRIVEARNRAPIGVDAAINITSLLGIKGRDYGSCSRANINTLKSSHTSAIVLSAVYDPSRLETFVAWEDGANGTWTPASCNTYVQVQLTKFFESFRAQH